jgi:N-acetylneuraminic acid mutarotase
MMGTGLAPRYFHSAAWTGTEMIIWGGLFSDHSTYYAPLDSGGKYNPSTNSWVLTSTTNAPSIRYSHTAVWTGTQMIVWGGYPYTNTGGRYDPAADSWTATSTTGAPFARDYHIAVWTGDEMIVWGGQGSGNSYFNTGGRYNPVADSWIATSTSGAPAGSWDLGAVWTGDEMIVWGGEYYDGGVYYRNTGGIYYPGIVPLGEGEHTFEVRAFDQLMNVDLTPATYTWNIIP